MGELPHIKSERVPAGSDVDTAMVRTVEKMCEYIRAAKDDPRVQACARYAWQRFGGRSSDPRVLAWAVFWYLRHCVRFQQDEKTMYTLGLEGEQDLLIDPRVLSRMAFPVEDCDGFSMFGAALLEALGVTPYLAVVAASPRDPRRWSHVFVLAQCGDGLLPVDASHGSRPGWSVPPEHMYRFAAFDTGGREMAHIKVAPGLHGYRQTGRTFQRGLGDDVSVGFPWFSGGDGSGGSDSGASASFPWLTGGGGSPSGGSLTFGGGSPSGGSLTFSGGSGSDSVSALFPWFTGSSGAGSGGGGSAGGSGASSDFSKFFQQLALQGVNITGKLLAPPAYQQTIRNPITGEISTVTVAAGNAPSSGVLSSFFGGGSGGSISPVILYGGLALLGIAAIAALKGR